MRHQFLLTPVPSPRGKGKRDVLLPVPSPQGEKRNMELATLTFHLTPTGVPRDDFDATDAFSQAFIHSLGLNVHSGCWANINLDSPAMDSFIREARNLILAEKATFYGMNTLYCTLPDDADHPHEWYELTSYTRFESEGWKSDIETCKAFRMPPTAYIAAGMHNNLYVSEHFKTIVEEHQLTGIDFVWVKDVGKYRAPQWFVPVPLKPLGRGVDHPWYQPTAIGAIHSRFFFGINWRSGQHIFDMKAMRREPIFTKPVFRNLFSLYGLPGALEGGSLTIAAYRTHLRHFLPETDFAYAWDDKSSARILCISRKARDVLLAAKVITPDDTSAIQILDTPPLGCAQLDGHGALPPSRLTPAQVTLLQKRLAQAWEKQQRTPKPIRATTLKEVLRLIRKAKRERPDDFQKPAKHPDFAQLPVTLPAHWIALLSVTNGAELDAECSLFTTTEITAAYHEKRELIAETFDVYPYDYPLVPIASNPSGDWYALENRDEHAEDARVVLISHEDCTVIYTWESIPLLIFDFLSGFHN